MTIRPVYCTCTAYTVRNITAKTFGVELEADIFVDLPVDINTSVVYPKGVAVLRMVRRPIFDHVETRTSTHADGNPLVVVGLDRACGVCIGDSGCHPSH